MAGKRQVANRTERPNKEMKLTSVERIGRSQLISRVRRTVAGTRGYGHPTHKHTHARGGLVEVSFSMKPTPYVRSKYGLPFGAISTAPPGSVGGYAVTVTLAVFPLTVPL
jgi:hypothetical protein